MTRHLKGLYRIAEYWILDKPPPQENTKEADYQRIPSIKTHNVSVSETTIIQKTVFQNQT